jgi:hypothetical protein
MESQGGEGDLHLGPAPDVDDIAELLKERHRLKKGDVLRVSAEAAPLPQLELALDSGRDRYTIGVGYLRGANGRDPWMLLADALDSLLGMLLESERAYRDLPAGDDVSFDGAFFRVAVERTVPDLDARADRMLEGD